MRVDDLPLPPKVIEVVRRRGIEELYPPQEEAIRAGVLERRNILLSTPTASGKTLVAELAMVKNVLEGYGKAIYLTPLRALATEKFEEFRVWEELGIRVAISTGDYDSRDAWLRNYDIIVTSLPEDEVTVVISRGELIHTTFRELLNRVDDLFHVLSVDVENLQVVEAIPSLLIRYPYSGPVIELEFCNGRSVRVTPNHSIYVFDRNEVKLYEAQYVKRGMKVPAVQDGVLKSLEVKRVSWINYRGYVCDFSVPGYENFIAGDACVLCHNTYEKLDSLIRHRAPWLSDVGTVVIDEIHMISEVKRGPTLEMLITKLRKRLRGIQLIALSATIGNPEEIASWLGATPIVNTWRPTPLKEGVYVDGTVEFSDGTIKKLSPEPLPYSLVRDCLLEGGQVLIFVSTRQRAVQLAEKLSDYVRKLLDSDDLGRLSSVAEEIYQVSEASRIGEQLAKLIQCGVSYHHAGLSHAQRRVIERAFRSRVLKVVVATPTLAAGVNLPARRVVVYDYRRYEPGRGYVPITIMEYKQMAGRAGRPQFDEYGEAILIARCLEEKRYLMERYILANPEPITSKLATESSLRTHVLATIAEGFAKTIGDVEEVLKLTFYFHQQKLVSDFGFKALMRSTLTYLESRGFISVNGDEVKVTNLGARVCELYIDPETASIILSGLRSRKQLSELGYLYLIALTPDIPRLYVRRSEVEKYVELLEKYRSVLPLDVSEQYGFVDVEDQVPVLKTAYLLYRWINEASEDEIVEEFDVGSGDLRSYVELGEWLLYSAHSLAKLLGLKQHAGALNVLMRRVKYGVRAELLELVENLEGVGRVRARYLYRYGFKTLRDIAEAPLEKLMKVPTIGPTLARRIKEQASELLKRGVTEVSYHREKRSSLGGEVLEGYGRKVDKVRKTLLDYLRESNE
ncbi:MAG: hypothetical protein DRJ40_00455 [Thermoprotei archaeon]|nr:MAG: hypothetical protein DRJ40_00455 [Thermoprotei archaeon]